MEKANPFGHLLNEIVVDGQTYRYYNLNGLKDERVNKLPYSIRVLLESALRNCDEFNVKCKYIKISLTSLKLLILRLFLTGKKALKKIWKYHLNLLELSSKISRNVYNQIIPYSGVPAVVDLAAMRDAT